MLLTSIMCGLVGCLIGRLGCKVIGYIAQTNPRVRVTNTKGTSSEHLAGRLPFGITVTCSNDGKPSYLTALDKLVG